MKHKILIGSLIVTLFAFILYTSNIKRVENAQLKIVEPNNSKVAKNKKKTKEPKVKKLEKPKEPKVNSIEYSNHVKAQKGSNQKLVKQIKKVMGIDDSFQVVAQDLTNSSHFAVVSNTNKAHDAGKTMRLFLLIALYEQEQKGKMGSRTAIKISKKDKAKGDKMFQVGITYKTAASALTRKIGVNNIDQVAKKMGATQTKVNSNMTGQTTANDLAKTMIGLYQGRVLNRQYASRVLATLAKERPSLVSGLSGGIYAIGDDDFAVAIVQTNGRAYCMSVWSTQHKNFNKLGKTVNAWFIKKHK